MSMGTGGLILLLILTLTTIPVAPAVSNDYLGASRGLYILVSFPNLALDVGNITCPSDRVEYIAPPGVDPHTYTLTPSDRHRIMEADVIISTAHTGFEMRIREMNSSRLIHGVLVEIPRIPGMKIMDNPVTHQPNLHMPIYDPYNYIVFINYIAKLFSKLNPYCSSYYLNRAELVAKRVYELINNTPRVNATALAEAPYMQYAVSWTGIKIKYLLVKEEDTPATPEDLLRIREALSRREISVVLVSYPPVSVFSQRAISLAREYNVSIIYVPVPMGNSSIVSKLGFISRELAGFGGGFGGGLPLKPPGSHEALETTTTITGLLLLATMIIYVLRVGKR